MRTQSSKVTTEPQGHHRGALAAFVAAFLTFSALPNTLSADLFWAGNSTTPNVADGGTWVTSAVQWSATPTSTPTVTWVNANGDVAHFIGSGGGTVLLDVPTITAGGISFDSGANGYVINTDGNNLILSGFGITNASGLTQTIINNGRIAVGAGGGVIQFLNTSSAGTATITNNGGIQTTLPGAVTQFLNASSAGTATITNNGGSASGAGDGGTAFFNTSTAGDATITNNGATADGGDGGYTLFNDTSTAAGARITNNGGSASGAGGFTEFFNTSSAGTATITNNGGSASGAGGFTEFFNTSSAGTATITNNGAAVAGGAGGFTEFLNTSTAGDATIITNGGSGSGAGGETSFTAASDGGMARAVTNGNGRFDISGLTTVGMGIGSIEGSGNYFLGGKTLTVGGNNLSTTVSGVIQDGGGGGGTGGSLTKVGTGALTLTGANTYSGGTNLNGGTLAVNGDANLGTGPLRFNGGTLETLAAGGGLASGKAITLNVGGGTFLADAGTASTFSGIINGVGSFTKNGLGTLTLTGTNTYSGGTNLNGGTLAVNGDANLGVGPLSFNGGTLEASAAGGGLTSGKAISLAAGGGTFLADAGTVSTLGGAISGPGAWTKAGPGTLVLTGNNTYTGGTTISAGTLQLGNGGTTGSLVGNVADAGTLTFDHSNVITFGGVISGPGSVTQAGTGTTILTADNAYTGGTSIASGSTLQLGNGGPTGSVAGPILDNGTLAVNRSADLLVASVISGAGDFQQNGSGTTTLTADSTYAGATTVNAGRLIVDGSIGSPSSTVAVNAGGLLGGNGTIRGNVVNNGIVSPGDPVGTLAVTGNYTQTPGGTLRINVAPGASSLLAVGGRASLGGGGRLQLVPTGGFSLQVGQQVTFLTAAGGVTGSFAALENPFIGNTLVEASVVTLANSVLVEGAQGSVTEAVTALGPTPNRLSVAHAVDAAAGDPRAAGLIAFLNSQPLGNLPHDMDLIAPDEVTSTQTTGAAVGNVQTSNVGQRLETVRAGSTGFSSAGFALNGQAPTLSAGLAGVSGPEGKSGPSAMAPIPQNRWGVFITGLGEFTNVGSTYNAAGFDVRTAGVTLGADYRLTPYLIVGLTAGYAHTWTDLAQGGSLDADGGIFGAYASLFGHGFYLDAALMGGPTGYDSRRGGLQGTARGSTDGTDFNAMAAGGYDWKVGALSLGPTARFQYSSTYVDGFTEHGSLAPLKLNDQHAESKRTDFGVKATYDWKVGGVTIKPELRAAWQHEYGTTEYAVVSAFASGAGTPFGVTGPDVGHDSLLIGAGAAVLWGDRLATYIYYDGEIGRANYEAHAVSAGVRVTF